MKATLIGLMIIVFHDSNGNMIIINYSTVLVENMNNTGTLQLSPLNATVILGISLLFWSLLSIPLVNYFKKFRPLLIISHIGMLISTTLVATFTLKDLNGLALIFIVAL
jgi:hypothetical protein